MPFFHYKFSNCKSEIFNWENVVNKEQLLAAHSLVLKPELSENGLSELLF